MSEEYVKLGPYFSHLRHGYYWLERRKKDVKYYVSNPFQTVELDASAGPTLTTEPMSQPGPGRAVG